MQQQYKTAPQGEANSAAVAAATADPVDAGNCDAGGNSSNAAPAAAGSATRVGSGAQPHMVGGADGSERAFDKAQQLRLQSGMPSLNVVAVRKNCALVQPNAVNRSACNFAALRATSTAAHRNEAKIRDAIVVALKLAANACSYVSQLSLVLCHSGQHFHEKWRFGPLAEHAEKVVPIVLTTLRQQARVTLTQVEKTFAALLEGARLQDHALLLKMWYAAISNINESMFAWLKGSNGLDGKPNACINHVAAPKVADYNQLLDFPAALGALVKSALLRAGKKVMLTHASFYILHCASACSICARKVRTAKHRSVLKQTPCVVA